MQLLSVPYLSIKSHLHAAEVTLPCPVHPAEAGLFCVQEPEDLGSAHDLQK